MRDTVGPGVSAPALLLTTDKITVSHRSRDAYVYVRQSTPSQMVQHTESLARQYELRERAVGSARDTMPARLSTFAQVARQPIRKGVDMLPSWVQRRTVNPGPQGRRLPHDG